MKGAYGPAIARTSPAQLPRDSRHWAGTGSFASPSRPRLDGLRSQRRGVRNPPFSKAHVLQDGRAIRVHASPTKL
jgi:hypothetical protein